MSGCPVARAWENFSPQSTEAGVISVFRSIRRTETLNLNINEIERAYLSSQTRVYIREDQDVRIGRVTDYMLQENGLVHYEVRFPNGRRQDFSELDLFVRPWSVPEDPADILSAGGAESQFLHDRRQAAVMPLLSLRSAAQGLTSLMSASIDLVPHQVAAVRRVLSDPIQRYLLADEVGLGKTIEAGLIIRQHLIDNPDTEILIATPPHLLGQWRGELIDKLRLDQFGQPFECCMHAALARVSRPPDILVVDEAHHLVGQKSGSLAHAAERLRDLARDAPVLLLLSATPALGDESKFLALLNLLDPITHPLGDINGFRAKLEQRRHIGRLLLSLDPDAPGLVLRQRGSELQRLFPTDPLVQDLAPAWWKLREKHRTMLPAYVRRLRSTLPIVIASISALSVHGVLMPRAGNLCPAVPPSMENPICRTSASKPVPSSRINCYLGHLRIGASPQRKPPTAMRLRWRGRPCDIGTS